MTADLAHQRCFNHAGREAVACCPECGRYFCRECVTEHEDRVVCASCLAGLAGDAAAGKSRLGVVLRATLCAAGLLTVWLFFYAVGQGLLVMPSSFHEGTVWQVDQWEP